MAKKGGRGGGIHSFSLEIGSFLLTADLFCLQLCLGAFLLTAWAFLLTVRAFMLTDALRVIAKGPFFQTRIICRRNIRSWEVIILQQDILGFLLGQWAKYKQTNLLQQIDHLRKPADHIGNLFCKNWSERTHICLHVFCGKGAPKKECA